MNVFVIKNQSDLFCSKHEVWIDESSLKDVLIFKNNDEALNHLLELNIKDINLRGIIVEVEQDERGNLTFET